MKTISKPVKRVSLVEKLAQVKLEPAIQPTLPVPHRANA